MKTRLIAPAIALLLLAAGCSASEGGAAEPSAQATTTAAATTPAPKPSRTAKPAPAPTTAPPPAAEELADAEYERRYVEAGMDAIGGVGSAINLGRRNCGAIETVESKELSAVPNFMAAQDALDPIAVEVFCPQYAGYLPAAASGFGDGAWIVGTDIAPGAYKTEPGVVDCYWERTSGSGETIANDFVSLSPDGVTVTVREGEGLVTSGCAGWLPVS